MSLSHLLKSANRRLSLSILQNQQGSISSSASYRASRHTNRKIEIIKNKQQQSCSDAALHKKSVRLIVLPLWASLMVVMFMDIFACVPLYFKMLDPHRDGKPVYSAEEVEEAINLFHFNYLDCSNCTCTSCSRSKTQS